ncbi:extracellular solute-binding protein [Paenibacillus aurantius]|uniref:Extracellular solute-binding protein n=1 Tax=Paenibacillus aurantius TaxID=2918900 RepID=A0AA96LCN5_9BACL|nr:extracellular solute-binding protein [Paenibacillus aurantius]WNQ10890.1 extracellular solute-binding protein [Paenibacillus aurantius]
MNKIQPAKWLAVTMMMASVLAACSKAPGDTASSAKPNTSSPPAGTASAQPAPTGKYDPPIVVTDIRPYDDNTKFAPGDSSDNNLWSKKYEEKLGIKIKYLWTLQGPIDQYYQKLNVAIASNDLADIVTVNAQQLKQLAEAGQIADLTSVFDKYATPFVKKTMNEDGGTALKSATFGGKLLAIPRIGSDIDEVPMLWVRTDWLKKLNLPEPKTMADVLAISEAFTNKNPDGDGKADTFGLALSKDLNGGFPGFEGFLNGYHAYYNVWLKDASGKLVNSNIQPEMKTALGELQKLYKAKQIDKEFGTKDGAKIAEMVTSGKIGMYYGLYWTPAWPLQDGKNLDPNMEWHAYPLPSVDGKPSDAQVPFSVAQYYVVRKNAEHPEAAVKMLNLWMEESFNSPPSQEKPDPRQEGIETFKHAIIAGEPITKNMGVYTHVAAALKAKDPSSLTPVELGVYNDIMAYEKGDNKKWFNENIYGLDGSFKIIDYYVKNNLIRRSEFFGSPTQAMGEKGSTLDTLLKETFTKIIMGAASIDEFDKFVEDWKKLGGDQITKEVNEWKTKQ